MNAAIHEGDKPLPETWLSAFLGADYYQPPVALESSHAQCGDERDEVTGVEVHLGVRPRLGLAVLQRDSDAAES